MWNSNNKRDNNTKEITMATFTQKEGVSGVLSYGLYRMYKDQFKGVDKNSESNVGYLKWLKICKKFNERILNGLLEGYIFKMPYKLGSLGIIQDKKKLTFDENGKLNTDNLVVDWDKTMNLWRKEYPECKCKSDYKKIENKPVVYYTNEHTDGRVFKFHWKKITSSLKNKSVYSFKISPKYKKELKHLIDKNPNVQFCTKF
jgi:hypothetical protein